MSIYIYIKNVGSQPGLPGATRRVDRVSPGQLPDGFLFRPGPVPYRVGRVPGRPAGPVRVSKLCLRLDSSFGSESNLYLTLKHLKPNRWSYDTPNSINQTPRSQYVPNFVLDRTLNPTTRIEYIGCPTTMLPRLVYYLLIHSVVLRSWLDYSFLKLKKKY